MRRAFIIGGANIDIQGVPDTRLIMQDSNPGIISHSFGGVGRNIAENLARLNDAVVLVSVMGRDPYGTAMFEHCKALGMDMTFCLQSDDMTAHYLAILDAQHDMALAVCDARILRHLDETHLQKVFDVMLSDDILVLDTNLDERILSYVFAHCPCRIYLDPISTKKAEKITPYLSHLYMLKPNRIEAEMISGMRLDSLDQYRPCLQYFLDAGVHEIVISMGAEGVLAANEQEMMWIRHPYVAMKNATGAGDSFVSGYVHEALRDGDMHASLRFAIASAMLNVQSEQTVSERMTLADVSRYMNEIEMERINL